MMRNILTRKLKIDAISGALVVAAFFLAGTAQSQTVAPDIDFSTARKGEYIVIEGRVDLAVAPALAWAVLTDYENYPKFISSMRESKIVSRSPEGLVVEQKGTFRFLFIAQEIDSSMLVTESPPSVIVARSIKGNIQDMYGRYELQEIESGVRMSYSGRLIPSFSVPPLIGLPVVNFILKRNFREMVDEIVRRDAVTRQPVRKDG